jgi:phosphoserine phosphatase
MLKTAVTLVGDIDQAVEKRAAELIRSAGVESLHMDKLEAGRAVDFLFEGANDVLIALLRAKFANFGRFDVFVQPHDESRKKKLLMADMDATMVEGETLDELAAFLGLKDQIEPITTRAMQGEIDFQESLRMRVALLKGVPVAKLAEVLSGMRPSKGASTVVKSMNRQGAKCILVSGGFDFYTGHVGSLLGFYKNFGNRLDVHNDHLTGEVVPPILGREQKKEIMEREAAALGLQLHQVMSIGDGANDLSMLQAAGAGIGYFAKPAVQAAIPYQIRYTDMTALLYMQGYRRDLIAA